MSQKIYLYNDSQILFCQWRNKDVELKDITNIKDVSFFGLRRSGNHAIQNWIIKQNNSSYVLLNNVKLYTNQNPYQSFCEATISGICPLVYHKGPNKYRRYLKYLANSRVEYRYGGDRTELDRIRLREYKLKSLIIHSYEHYSLSHVLGDWFEEKRDKFIGKSQQKFDILILRDPFNLFASLIHRGENLDDPSSVINRWLEHAREFLGLSNYLKRRIAINYNAWFTNQDYRQEIATLLKLPFTDSGISDVVSVGRGSSFDGTTYNGEAEKMPVLARYKSYLDHPVMLKVTANEELKDLSSKIFGPII